MASPLAGVTAESQWHRWLEWCGYAQCFFSMNAEVSAMATPSYNFPLGLWALYCAHARSGRNVFAFLCFMAYSALMDVVYFSLWGGTFGYSSTSGWAIAMMVFNLLAKAVGLFCGYQLFVELGGAWSMRAGNGAAGVEGAPDHAYHDMGGAGASAVPRYGYAGAAGGDGVAASKAADGQQALA